MRWLVTIGVVSIILLILIAFIFIRPIRPRKINTQTEVVSNARQIGMALYDFNEEYGRYPDSTTAAEVKRKTGSTLTLGDRTSNDLFAQLIASSMTQSEKIFYAHAGSAIKPDDVYKTDATVLAHGECAFAYICGIDAAGDPHTPLAFGPVIPGTKTLDGKWNDGRAVVLTIDNSVTSIKINSSGQLIYGGMNLLDPGNPIWHDKAPDHTFRT